MGEDIDEMMVCLIKTNLFFWLLGASEVYDVRQGVECIVIPLDQWTHIFKVEYTVSLIVLDRLRQDP